MERQNMAKLKDISNQKFGNLTVIRRGNRKNGTYWLCKCSCGNEKEVLYGNLVSGRVISCGCVGKEKRLSARKTHGDSKTRLYNIWIMMKKRCLNEKEKAYKNYGKRGIVVCDEWINSYEEFKKWAISNGYKENLTLDRINNNGNYEPSNCRWADRKVQGNNTRSNVRISLFGETKTLAQWCEELSVSYKTVEQRRIRGWSDTEALLVPINN